VSQLNSERRGENLLLASFPPTWRSEAVRPLLRTEDMFKVFGSRKQVRELVKALREFLGTKPPAIEATRTRCDAYVDALVDEFIQFTAEQRSLAEGWSRDGECLLEEVAKRWLDPLGVPRDSADDGPDADQVTERITEGFARWLNERLRVELNVGTAEFREWRRRVREEVKAYAWEVDLEY
jgi:CRISPR-associated protein Csy1